MPEIEIYTTMLCPYCHRAKALLKRKGVPFSEIDVTYDRARRREMAERAGGRSTVPQIFVDGEHLGDSEDLAALEAEGELDDRLGAAS